MKSHTCRGWAFECSRNHHSRQEVFIWLHPPLKLRFILILLLNFSSLLRFVWISGWRVLFFLPMEISQGKLSFQHMFPLRTSPVVFTNIPEWWSSYTVKNDYHYNLLKDGRLLLSFFSYWRRQGVYHFQFHISL